jgi:acyl-CoA synthetase (NDP forming)
VYFNYVISSGNEAVTSLANYMGFAMQAGGTRVIALFLETIRDPAGFVAALAEAAERDVPVVALKVGRSPQGAALAQAHSGALAGEDAAYEAVFRRYGVCRVKSLDEMMDTLELFAAGFRPRARAVTALLDSGGERAMLADLAESEGVPLAEIGPATRERLAATLEPGLPAVNPLDAWGTGNDYDRIYAECLLALDAEPASGLTLFAVDLTRAGNFPPTYTDIALAMQARLSKPLAFLANLTACVGDDQAGSLRQAGIPVLMGTESGLRAVRHLLDYSEFQRNRVETPRWGVSGAAPDTSQLSAIRAQLAAAQGALGEHASKNILRAYGLCVPPEALADSEEEALAAAARIGYPVALKTAAGLSHKTDVGGVRLNLRDAGSLSEACRDLAALTRSSA